MTTATEAETAHERRIRDLSEQMDRYGIATKGDGRVTRGVRNSAGQRFESVREAARSRAGLSESSIRKAVCLNGRRGGGRSSGIRWWYDDGRD